MGLIERINADFKSKIKKRLTFQAIAAISIEGPYVVAYIYLCEAEKIRFHPFNLCNPCSIHYVTCNMLKKYLPFIFLIAAASLLYFVKTNQRGETGQKPKAEQVEDRIPVHPVLSAGENADEVDARPDDPVGRGFNRSISNIIFSKHAKCRMDCRKIDESEVKEILKSGKINYKKIQSDKRGKTYPVEGYTHDKQHVRIVFAPKGDDALVVVTVIDLETEWKCDCK